MPDKIDSAQPYFEFASKHFYFCLLNESHRDIYYSLYSDKVVMEKIAEPLGLKSLTGLFQHSLKHNKLGLINESKSLSWIIRDLSTNLILGIQGFIQNSFNPCEAEFGIMLLPGNHHKGIANECISALITLGFNNIEFKKLYANYTNQNVAIQRIAENLDFNIDNNQTQPNSKYCWLTKQEFVTRRHLFERN